MFILRFTFENHRSFRDENDLTLVQPRLKTSRPLDGSWAHYTNRVAAIYGPNASGKSGLLDALEFMRAAIRNSATAWSERQTFPRTHFRLDDTSSKTPSTYALDFVLDEVRYEYGFVSSAKGVKEEWLYYYPSGRRKLLFERSSDADKLTFGRDLKGGEAALQKATGPLELVLSKGAASNNTQLRKVWHALTAHISIADFGEASREQRLRSVIGELVEGTFAIEDLQIMLKVADIGISGAEVAEKERNPYFAKMMRRLVKAFEESDDEDDDEDGGDSAPQSRSALKLDEDDIEAAWQAQARSLLFKHSGAEEKSYDLPSDMQSTGTLTWLSLAAPALKTIRNGGVFVVDELDASLHPQLAQVMIQMFKDEQVNKRHAQLIFTTHDTYFMSPTSEVTLSPDEVWLVEKGRDGASELFSLADFSVRETHNLSRRYLQGRYGAVPAAAPSFLSGLIESGDARVLETDEHTELRHAAGTNGA